MRSYTARAQRSGRWWAISVDGLDGVYTQARRLDQAEDMARDAIAGVLDVPADTIDVAIVPELDLASKQLLDAMRRARAEADTKNAEAATFARRIARTLHDQGLPLRDIGEVLGVSYQRAHQLVADERSEVA